MQKSQIDGVTLTLAALAGVLALTQISGPFAWMSSIGALVAVLVLLSFDQEGYRTVFQSLGFSAVCGFCTAIASAIIYQLLANRGEIHLANNQWATEYLPLTCAFATAIFWAIDLMRMNVRKTGAIRVPRALGETRIFPDVSVAAVPEPVSSRPAAQPAAATATESYGPAPPVQRPVETPVPTAPPDRSPVQAPESPTATSLFATEQQQPLSPGPTPIIPRSTGKETMIYVSLVGEGLNVLRSVRAEPLGRDYYRIIDEMPEGETWQFQPGQVVRCKKKNLSSGKAMVAMEEAPRAS